MAACEIHLGDCIELLPERVEPGTIDLTVTSIPFADLFMYSGKTEDVGNSPARTADFVDSLFGVHLRFFFERLFEATRPGCLACIHIQQLVAYKIEHGYMGRRDFRGAVIDVAGQAGWDYTWEVAIPKNPQVIAQRQKLHSLLFVTGRKDARMLAPAVNDFVLAFRRPVAKGEPDPPPVPALYDRDRNPAGWVTQDEWIRWARGVWDDVRETDVLDNWRDGRDPDDERHVCPLQLEVIRRCVMLHTSPGELVCDPFMGIGSTAWTALGAPSPMTRLSVGAPRRVVGFELKESYHAQAVRNAERATAGGADQMDIETAIAEAHEAA